MKHTIIEITKFGKNQSRMYKIDFLKTQNTIMLIIINILL
ncbi:hypothetical protein BAFK78_J016 (plasmid) [Borreliella afzelii K78]|nr:hypothetical protein BAFK78_J016 [Borreliella afzelii K78]